MKKISFIVLLFFAGSYLFGQDDLFFKIKKQLKDEHPEVATENKLIAVSFWSIANSSGRQTNAEFDKAVAIYKGAKLKGGSKGIIGVVICLDADKISSNIVLGKDNITNLTVVDNSGYSTNVSGTNFIYDSSGNLIKKDIPSGDVFESVHQLITR